MHLESINTEVPEGGILDMQFHVTSGSAQLPGGTLYAVRNRLNQRSLPPGVAGADTVRVRIPEFPTNNNPIIQFQLNYLFLSQNDAENDTIVFKIAIIDIAGKSSDTLLTPKIVIRNL